MEHMDPRLLTLVQEIVADLTDADRPPIPSREPAPGQSREDWLDEVRTIRDAHDAAAKVLAVHLVTDAPKVASVVDHKVEADGRPLTARVFTPEAPGPHPGIVFFHGGAWWLAGGETNFALTDDYCRTFAARVPAVVVNIDYRLAPEAPFPHQLHDSFAGLEWVVAHAAELDIDPERIAVMGASSGGNQAAAVCLMARERGHPRIAAQILHVPVLDLTGGSPSLREDPSWDDLNDVIDLYATGDQRSHPLASPLLADTLAGLPPAVIVTGEYDALRDDGRRYVERLAADGVLVRHLHYPMLHNIALPETSEQMFADMVGAINDLG